MDIIIFALILVGGVVVLFYLDHRARKHMPSH